MIYLAAIAVLIVLLLLAPIKIKLFYEEGIFTLKVLVWGVTVYSYKNKEPAAQKSPKSQASALEKKADSVLSKIRKITAISKTASRLLKKYVFIEVADIKIRIGTGDAAVTAVSTGALWATVYNFLGVVGRLLPIEKHNVEIIPDYRDSVFLPEAKCIIKSRAVYIIIIAITILRILKEE